jgi:hypothetical protein
VRYLEDPRQTELFDVFAHILSPVAHRRLTSGWQHLFRCAILKLMPAGKLAEHFDPAMGRPTKELYSMAGLLFIMEFRNLTHEEAADAYMFGVDVQYALNLQPENQSLCRRTIERYLKLFREDEMAQAIMHDVTAELVQLLELDVSKQRLDSTHIESNMAKFGRMKLMATTIRRFLVQVKRHDEGSYNALKKSVCERYEASDQSIFGWKSLDDDGVNALRQSIAEDLAYLVERYRRDEAHNSRSTYLMLVKVFEQQCEVIAEKVVVKKKTGGNIICNPSDPDATFDGHKGSGYQVQLSETYSADNSVQLIIAALPETACESDSRAIAKLIDHFDEHGHRPETLLADTAYGSDENFIACACNSPRSWCGPSHNEGTVNPVIELISPTSGREKGTTKESVASPEQGSTVSNGSAAETLSSPPLLTILDFVYDSQLNRFTHCPAGLELHRAHYREDEDQHLLLMLNSTCGTCQLKGRCPISRDPMLCQLRMNGKDLRLAQRRAAERTDEFKATYRMRGGIEATNSMLKRVTGLDRLRVRGRPAVFSSILLKVAGWNLLRAASMRPLVRKLTKGGASGQSALTFAASYRRHTASNSVLVA